MLCASANLPRYCLVLSQLRLSCLLVRHWPVDARNMLHDSSSSVRFPFSSAPSSCTFLLLHHYPLCLLLVHLLLHRFSAPSSSLPSSSPSPFTLLHILGLLHLLLIAFFIIIFFFFFLLFFLVCQVSYDQNGACR